MDAFAGLIAAALGGGLGFWLGGSWEWAWRGAVIALLAELVTGIRGGADAMRGARRHAARLVDRFAPYPADTDKDLRS